MSKNDLQVKTNGSYTCFCGYVDRSDRDCLNLWECFQFQHVDCLTVFTDEVSPTFLKQRT